MTHVTAIKSVATKEGAACTKTTVQLTHQQKTCTLTAGGWQHSYSMWIVSFLILVFQQEDRLQPQGTQNEEIKENGQPPCLTFFGGYHKQAPEAKDYASITGGS